jgi:superfamily I DNA/RNA helicase
MAKRKFRLPGVEELNKDQDRVLRLPEDGQFLIVGGPGTGKSVVALLRTIKFRKNEKKDKWNNIISHDYVFLSFNKTLNSATKQITGNTLHIKTLVSFFNEIFREAFTIGLNKKYNAELCEDFFKETNVNILKKLCDKDSYEKLDDDEKKIFDDLKNKYLPILKKHLGHDYKDILQKYQDFELDNEPEKQHLIIDEGQDMATSYYKCLEGFGFQNFFIVADQNQQITNENSSRKDLTEFLDLKPEEVIELKQNYRNSHPIALVAQHFFTDIASPKPELPQSLNTKLGTPTLYQSNDFENFIEFILREADRDTSNLIGAIVHTIDILDVFKKNLENMKIDLDNPKPNIQSYSSIRSVSNKKIEEENKKRKEEYKKLIKENSEKEYSQPTHIPVEINFGEGGIVILNDKSIKGLEFDTVFIYMNGFEVNNDLDSMRKRFYVMSSRAIKKLVFFHWDDIPKDLEKILPDKNILLRKELE